MYLGINAKLNEVHASMALASLDDIDDQIVRNRERYRAYQRGFATLPGIRLLEFDETERCGFKNIVVELTEEWPLSRDETVRMLNSEGALARAYYTPALHTKSYGFETRVGAMPVTEALAPRFILLPSGARVTVENIEVLISLLRQFAAEATTGGRLS
jgi:dTDP-4-amino-4,6-dideoxygalactose transaminase